MAATYIRMLKDAMSSLIYTEVGNGKKKEAHEANGTNRVAAEIGDMPRKDMAIYAAEIHKKHPASKYEALELRVSFSPDELKAKNIDDEKMALSHSYKLCKILYPNSLCYVTVHNDGKGECVHAHCLVVNHDEETGKSITYNRRHFEVKNASDELAAEEGLYIIGTPKFERDRLKEATTWDKRREECSQFEQRLGDKIVHARDTSEDIDEFKEHLRWSGVELIEQSKVDNKGVSHTTWTYKLQDIFSDNKRKRRRKANLLADDLTKEGIEAYFISKNIEKENNMESNEKVVIEEKEISTEVETFEIEKQDVKESLNSIGQQYSVKARCNARDLRKDKIYADITKAMSNLDQVTLKLQENVNQARSKFMEDKANLEAVKMKGVPSLELMQYCFREGCSNAKTPVERMLNDVFAQMMAVLIYKMLKEQQESEVARAEKELYESRKEMWDAEKKLKAANNAIDRELNRNRRKISTTIQDIADKYDEAMEEEFEFSM